MKNSKKLVLLGFLLLFCVVKNSWAMELKLIPRVYSMVLIDGVGITYQDVKKVLTNISKLNRSVLKDLAVACQCRKRFAPKNFSKNVQYQLKLHELLVDNEIDCVTEVIVRYTVIIHQSEIERICNEEELYENFKNNRGVFVFARDILGE